MAKRRYRVFVSHAGDDFVDMNALDTYFKALKKRAR